MLSLRLKHLAWMLTVLGVGLAMPLQRMGSNPEHGWTMTRKPLVVVLVVGETARAANWGLNGYPRHTTPQLSALPVINFANVMSCGTDTGESLSCMFAPDGHRRRDAVRDGSSENLLHVLARAGVAVHWRDNQSGCDGVCDGLPSDSVRALQAGGMCSADQCLDEGLLVGLEERLAAAQGAQLLVLHQLGSQGPSYFRRYPAPFARFLPACNHDDLSLCTRQEIVNAYDNALLYTDHVLAELITRLTAHGDSVDSVVLYVSDHGESLGEEGLFLHGIPHAAAPAAQKQVPMVMWLSAGAAGSIGLDTGCLRTQTRMPLTHDNLFHTLLGVFGVRTHLYEPRLDIGAACRLADTALS
jgi:lipid A ethanolaminephosphotransferase